MMTLQELSIEYRAHAQALNTRILDLNTQLANLDRLEDSTACCILEDRIHMLTTMLREARELAVLTERYYDRGYRRNGKYTL